MSPGEQDIDGRSSVPDSSDSKESGPAGQLPKDGELLIGGGQPSASQRMIELASPVAAEFGLEVLHAELSGGSSRHRVLRIYLDTGDDDRRVTVADCQAVSRELGDVLDAHEALAGSYMLEVSSPGLNRPLRTLQHFRRVIGQKIKVRLDTALDGQKSFVGKLVSVEDGFLGLESEDEGKYSLELARIERANLQYEFAEPPGRPRRNRKKKAKAE